MNTTLSKKQLEIYDRDGNCGYVPPGAPSTSSPDSYSRCYSAGRLVAMTYGTGGTGNYFGYDNMGRVSMQFQLTGSTPTKYKLSYAYNYAGLLTSETYPTSGRGITHTGQSATSIISVTDHAAILLVSRQQDAQEFDKGTVLTKAR